MSEFMPKMSLIDREFVVTEITEVAQRLGRFLFTTPTVHPYMSEHYRPNTGAAEMLDQQLYEQGRLEA